MGTKTTLTKKSLQEIADRKGIKYTSKTSKEDLQKAIDNAKISPTKGKGMAGEY